MALYKQQTMELKRLPWISKGERDKGQLSVPAPLQPQGLKSIRFYDT